MKAEKVKTAFEERIFKYKQQKKKNNKWSTYLLYFDINFKDLIWYIKKEEKTKLKIDSEISILHQNLIFLESLFHLDLKDEFSLLAIKNSSLIEIKDLYPELTDFYYNNSLLLSRDDIVKNKLSYLNKISLKNINTDILKNQSDMIDYKLANRIKNYFPAYLRSASWKLYYSPFRDGKSYKT